MKPILASELDEYLNSLKILDDNEDDEYNDIIFEGILYKFNLTGFCIKSIDDDRDTSKNRYFELDFEYDDGVYIILDSVFNNVIGTKFELIDPNTNKTIINIDLSDFKKHYINLCCFLHEKGTRYHKYDEEYCNEISEECNKILNSYIDERVYVKISK